MSETVAQTMRSCRASSEQAERMRHLYYYIGNARQKEEATVGITHSKKFGQKRCISYFPLGDAPFSFNKNTLNNTTHFNITTTHFHITST